MSDHLVDLERRRKSRILNHPHEVDDFEQSW